VQQSGAGDVYEARTSAPSDASLAGRRLSVAVLTNNQTTFHTDFTFTFIANPHITGISPRQYVYT